MKFETGRIHFLSDVFVVVAVVVGRYGNQEWMLKHYLYRDGTQMHQKAPYLAWPMVPLHETVTDKNTWIANDAVGQEIKNNEMTSFK